MLATSQIRGVGGAATFIETCLSGETRKECAPASASWRYHPGAPEFLAVCLDRSTESGVGRNSRGSHHASPHAAIATGGCGQRKNRGGGVGCLSGHRSGLSGSLHGADGNTGRAAFQETIFLVVTSWHQGALAGRKSQAGRKKTTTGGSHRCPIDRRNSCADSGRGGLFSLGDCHCG